MAQTYLFAPQAPNQGPPNPSKRLDAEVAAQERAGGSGYTRPKGPVVWLHTGQDPDAYAARELARRLLEERDDLAIVTTTSADRRRRSDAGPVFAQFAPNDTASTVRRFLDLWRPNVGVWTEPDMRANLANEPAEKGIPLYFLDSDTREVGTPVWRPWRRTQSGILAPFETLITGDPIRAQALSRVGAQTEKIRVMGYLQEGTAPPSCNTGERDTMAGLLQGRPAWLAAEIALAEAKMLLEAHGKVLERAHRSLLIVAPKVEADGQKILTMARDQGFEASLRSDGDDPDNDTQVYVADFEGEMGLWYRVAPVSFLGQSLDDDGGIDPFPAAALGSAILHGEDIFAYRGAYDRLATAGATRMVSTADALATELSKLLAPDVAAARAHAAWRISSAGAEVTDHALDLILTELDRQEAE